MRWVCAAALLVALWGCGASEPRYGVCRDDDHDGRGEGCARGPDCDDNDPHHFEGCSDASRPPSDCEAEPTAPLCPCVRGERRACFAAAADSVGVGPCLAGLAQCSNGAWTECVGAVLPALETCNEIDDDCDGFTDEGVQSPCGGCNPDCRGGVWGPPAAPFAASDPLALTPNGELTLRWQPSAAGTLWVPNTDEGTVSKLDAREARELARYRTRGGYPIGVAVDHRGDAWVLDGAYGGAPYLSKIAGEAARCRQGRTSRSADELYAAGSDACVVVEVPLTAADDAQTLALDGALAPDSQRAGHVWLGLAGTHALAQLDGSTGEELSRHALPDVTPYAAAFDRFGVLWLLDRAGVLARFDPADPGAWQHWLAPFACFTLEALSLDAQGRLFLSGFGCESVLTYDPARDSWRRLQVPGLLSPRGLATIGDSSWVGYSSGAVALLARDPLAVAAARSLAADMLTPFETMALSADDSGQLWAISTQGGPDGVGLATRFDPGLGEVTAQVPVGRGPRARGDFSGYASGGEFAAQGRATHVFGGCGREARDDSAADRVRTRWLRLRVAAWSGAGTRIAVSIRRAESEDALAALDFRALGELPADGSVFPLDVEAGGALEVALDLYAPVAIGAPRIGRVGVEWECPGPE